MKTGILLVTYAKDFAFAKYACQAAQKFTSGFTDYLIVVPNPDVAMFSEMAVPYGWRVLGFDEPPEKGMLAHMAVIIEADRWLPDCDAILHIDSDCIFWEQCTPTDFFQDEKPILYREKFDDFRNYGARYSWKKCVENATGIDPFWETMVRHPMLHLKRTYQLTQDIINAHTGMSYKEYILSGRNEFPQSFAEFPTLGAVANALAHDDYHWVDWSCVNNNYVYEHGRDKLIALWSHGGLDAETDRHPGKTARQVIEEILK